MCNLSYKYTFKYYYSIQESRAPPSTPPSPSRCISRYIVSSILDRSTRKLWLSKVGGYVVLVNSSYNLSCLSSFRLSYYSPSPSPSSSRPNYPPISSFSHPRTRCSFSSRIIRTQSHSHTLAYFTFLRVFFSSFFCFFLLLLLLLFFLLFFFVWSEQLYIFTSILHVVV